MLNVATISLHLCSFCKAQHGCCCWESRQITAYRHLTAAVITADCTLSNSPATSFCHCAPCDYYFLTHTHTVDCSSRLSRSPKYEAVTSPFLSAGNRTAGHSKRQQFTPAIMTAQFQTGETSDCSGVMDERTEFTLLFQCQAEVNFPSLLLSQFMLNVHLNRFIEFLIISKPPSHQREVWIVGLHLILSIFFLS